MFMDNLFVVLTPNLKHGFLKLIYGKPRFYWLAMDLTDKLET